MFFQDIHQIFIICPLHFCDGDIHSVRLQKGTNMIQDMTSGNPAKLIVKFSIPLLIGNIFQQLYNISDIIIVGRLIGVNALAAVGASAPLYFVLLLVILGFTGGLTVITAQEFGAKNEDGVRKSVVHSLVASMVLSLVMTLFMFFYMKELLQIMNVPQEIMPEALKFIRVLCAGLVLIVGYNLLSFFMRALGDSRTPLYFLIFSSVLNIFLNLLFIYVFKMGVVGSALGTIVAISISVIACIVFIGKKFPILHLTRKDWKLDGATFKKHLDIAVPMSIQFSIIAFGVMIIQSVCNSFGPEVIAAFTSALRIEQLATQPLVAIGLAVATFSAQNFGAGMIGRIRRGVFICSMISLVFSIFMALVVRYGGENMIQIFIDGENANIIDTAKDYLNISTLFYFFLGQIFIFRNALQGMGRAKIPLLASIVELVMRALAAVYLAKQYGYIGICYASPIAWVGGALVVDIGYWLTIKKLKGKYWHNQMKWLGNKLKISDRHCPSPLHTSTPAE